MHCYVVAQIMKIDTENWVPLYIPASWLVCSTMDYHGEYPNGNQPERFAKLSIRQVNKCNFCCCCLVLANCRVRTCIYDAAAAVRACFAGWLYGTRLFACHHLIRIVFANSRHRCDLTGKPGKYRQSRWFEWKKQHTVTENDIIIRLKMSVQPSNSEAKLNVPAWLEQKNIKEKRIFCNNKHSIQFFVQDKMILFANTRWHM